MSRWEDGIPGHVVDGGFLGFWISIPSESTLRFPVSKATYYVLQPSGALILSQDLLPPIWHLAADIRKQYFLKAKFKGLGGEKGPSYENWRGTLSLPPVRLPPDPKPHVNQGHL